MTGTIAGSKVEDNSVALDDIKMEVVLVIEGVVDKGAFVIDKVSVLERAVVEGVTVDGKVLALDNGEGLTASLNVTDPEVIVITLGIAKETTDCLVTDRAVGDDAVDKEACLTKDPPEVVVASGRVLEPSKVALLCVAVEFMGTVRTTRGTKAWLEKC